MVSPDPSCWSTPCPSTVKINCDGTFFDKLKMGLSAFIVRNHIGALIDGKISIYSYSYPVMVEAKAILDATMFASLYVSSLVMIEPDSKVDINAILMEASLLPRDATGLVEAIRDAARKVPKISCLCVYGGE